MRWITLITVLSWCFTVFANDTLVLIHVVMRHCERTPDIPELYPKSPYNNETIFLPYGFGHLTNIGKKNCYEIGTALRQRYQHFINSAYHYSIVEGLSSHVARAKESLQLVLAGLFPPTEELLWLPGMNWLPIATHSTKKNEDLIVMPCATDWFEAELHKFENTEEGKVQTAHFNDLTEYMQQHTGLEEIDIRRTSYLSLGIIVLADNGLELPEWINSIYPNITNYYNQYTVHQFATKRLKRIACGYLLRKIVDETEMRINGSSRKQIIIYSGHDITLASLFQILKVCDGTAPPFGTYAALEVHNVNGIYGFKLNVFNRSSSEPFPVDIPGYGEFVPLEDLKKERQEYLHLDDLKETSNCIRISPCLTTLLISAYLYLNMFI